MGTLGPILKCSYLHDKHILKRFYLNLNSLGGHHYRNWWWWLRGVGQNFPENSQLFIFLGKCILLPCVAALVTRAV